MTARTSAKMPDRMPAKRRPLNILLIEDVEDDALLLVRYLEKNGFDILYERVESADRLRAVLKKRTWDVILCDHGLTGFNSLAALDIVKAHGLDPPFIVVSGTIGEEKAADMMRAGIHDLILKGNLSRLVPAIDRGLREAELRRAKAKSDDELDMERRLLRNLMASLPVSIYFKDLQHRYFRLNEAEARVLNAESAESVIGKTVDDFLSPDRARMQHEEEQRIFATGEPLLDRIEEAPQKDGSVRWFAATKAPIRDRDGRIIGLVGVTRDITRRTQAENALKQNEAFFRAIVDFAPAAVVIKDPQGRNVVANRMFCRWYGTTPDKLVGKTHDEFLDKEAANRVWAQERKVLETKTTVEEERRITYPDGVTRDVMAQKFPILDPDGKLLAVGTVIADMTERKRMEESLRSKTRQLEVVLESMDQGMYAVDADLNCTLINRRYAETYGLPPELSRPGVRFEELARFNAIKGRYGPGDVEEHVKRREKLARANRPARYEFDLRNGRIVELRSNPLPDGGFVRTSTDITERKQVEQALRDSEERFRAILEGLPTAVSLRDRAGRFLVANRTLCSWMGVDPDAVIGKTVFDVYPESEAADVHHRDLDVFSTGEVVVAESKRSYADGKARDLIVHRCPIRGVAGDIVAVSTIATDITDRRKAEDQIRKLSTIIEQSPAAVTVTDTDGTIEYVNDAFSDITGYTRVEAIGQNPRLLKTDRTPPEVFAELWQAITAGRTWRGTFHNRKKDGSVYVAGSTIFPITGDDGKISHFIDTQQNITERINEQNRLKQAEKMESLGSLAGGIAHDFNNMLLPILALSKMILRKLPDDSDDREKLEKIIQAATRAKDLVAQILAFSRQEDAQQKDIDIVSVVKETLGLLRTTLPSSIKLDENLTLDAGQIRADAAQIGTVLLNLASNARDAMDGKPGSLEITLTRTDIAGKRQGALASIEPGAYARIRIKDTGHGMDEATMKRIFEPFFTTKAVGKGTGLGMATAYGIITKHGGAIDVASEPGKGTTFDVYLPLVDGKQAGANGAPARDIWT